MRACEQKRYIFPLKNLGLKATSARAVLFITTGNRRQRVGRDADEESSLSALLTNHSKAFRALAAKKCNFPHPRDAKRN
ncbi:hypothetical protein NDU88_004240 [Pleurodeles waltl]|uniref:Uncharacterized protein n=1 Tax=Pleurodeles waltl TaxID=8319 RepID=A0AAV7SI90_PLEWA|nr:hypothetical protein NDU88_004240 [Pleurodeles waltl]